MNENEKNWYTGSSESPEARWYGAAAQRRKNDAARLQKAAEKKERRRTVLLSVAVAAVLCGAAAAITLGMVNRASAGTGKPETHASENTPPKAEDTPDYRKYFEEYYTPYDEAKACDIPRLENRPNLVLSLVPAEGAELSYQEIYEKCAPATVAVRAYTDAEDEDSYYWGSGVIFTQDGFILTNSHVVEGTCRATVLLWNDEEYDALLVGNDPASDLAILKIDAKGLTAAEFGTAENLTVGDSVVAIGSPLGETFRSTMTEGIISGIDRDISHNGISMTLLQTSTPINEGNSGGALINRQGQVIGITNMKMSSQYSAATIEGVGLAIPVKTIKTVADSLLASGEMLRPALGLTVGQIPDDAKKTYDLPEGLYVTKVSENSDCARQGLQVGDIILTVNGKPAVTTDDVTDEIEGRNIGDTLDFTVWREGETFEVTVQLVNRNDVY